ncbi:hypothetical protein ACWDOR_11520 [Streptosporangium canum]
MLISLLRTARRAPPAWGFAADARRPAEVSSGYGHAAVRLPVTGPAMGLATVPGHGHGARRARRRCRRARCR